MSVFDTSKTTTTSLPSWFSTAQQGIAKQAPITYGGVEGVGGVTDPSKTVASGLITDLNSATANPFTTAISGLQTAQNANLKPFLSTGGPDTSTPLGALFASQNARLDQLLPQITSQVGAGGIGTGNYNSLRGQTATETARAGALASLNEQQNKALMDAMGQSIQAGSVLGNVGSQYGTTGVNVANLEMMGGLPALSKYSDIINAMGPSADRTATETTQGSQYENLLKGLNAAYSGGAAWDKISSGNTGLSWLDKILGTSGTQFVDENGNLTNDRTNYEEARD
jgi:hypothetical protein